MTENQQYVSALGEEDRKKIFLSLSSHPVSKKHFITGLPVTRETFYLSTREKATKQEEIDMYRISGLEAHDPRQA